MIFVFELSNLMCVISIIQSLLKDIWKADHPNYEEDDDQPMTSYLLLMLTIWLSTSRKRYLSGVSLGGVLTM